MLRAIASTRLGKTLVVAAAIYAVRKGLGLDGLPAGRAVAADPSGDPEEDFSDTVPATHHLDPNEATAATTAATAPTPTPAGAAAAVPVAGMQVEPHDAGMPR